MGARRRSLAPLRASRRAHGPAFLSHSRSGASAVPRDYWALSALDPTHPTSSLFAPPWALLLLRGGAAVYVGTTLALIGARGAWGVAIPWMAFFTNWTFCLFGVWALLGAVVSARAVLASRCRRRPRARPSDPGGAPAPSTPGSPAPLAPRRSDVESPPASPGAAPPPAAAPAWPRLDAAFALLTSIVAPASFFLSFFFWAFLWPHIARDTGKGPNAHTIMEHGGNVALLVLDCVLSRGPAVTLWFQLTLLYGTAYVIFMWAWQGATGEWVYPVFSWDRPMAAGAYAVLPFLLAGAFGLWYGLAAAREAVGRALAARKARKGDGVRGARAALAPTPDPRGGGC